MRVIPVPCLRDNYAYLVTADDRMAFVVDPSEAGPIERALEREGLALQAILCTHHHLDHVGGNEALVDRWSALRVFAHVSDRGRVPKQTDAVEEGAAFEVAGLRIAVLHVPGHTLGADAYVVDDAVFTGDTLFIAGCGRLFEGSAAMMRASLEKIAALPEAMRVYCGHEYTLANLRFAAEVAPSADVDAARRRATALLERGEPSVPSTIAIERAINPFLRVGDEAVRARFAGDMDAVFAAVRAAKDAFR